ncbi:hypothetical protein CA54_27960 [Symmachiella macrocystis]|uniref:Uncharacterized protein n=1 Tax=Symmachiella macrocystis TaxID=2527985 RepID=A0A5C6BTE3_9PLAN|nr:hypothetical protein CA54_27960 [Symmachiella macrocystis]
MIVERYGRLPANISMNTAESAVTRFLESEQSHCGMAGPSVPSQNNLFARAERTHLRCDWQWRHRLENRDAVGSLKRGPPFLESLFPVPSLHLECHMRHNILLLLSKTTTTKCSRLYQNTSLWQQKT